MPSTALCLKRPGQEFEELVVHRDPQTGEDLVFLFESLDDAYDYARMAEEALGFTPLVCRIALRTLHFRKARFKSAVDQPRDLPLHQ